MSENNSNLSVTDYGALLSSKQKIQLIENRIAQFAAEAYQHSLNKKTAEAIEATEQIASAEKSIAILDSAINVHKQELESVLAEQAAAEAQLAEAQEALQPELTDQAE
jgi:chromosome segregation ATPase